MFKYRRIDLFLVLLLFCLFLISSCSPSLEELSTTTAGGTASVAVTYTLTITLTPPPTPTETPTLTPTLTPIPPTPPDISGELLWFAPNFSQYLPENQDQENECWDLFLPEAPWSQAKEHVDVIQIDQPALSSYRIDENEVVHGFPLTQAIEFINQTGKYLSIQVLGPGNGVCSGEEAGARDLVELAKILQLGREINFIVIPAPIEQMIRHGYENNCNFTFEQAAEQLSQYISLLRIQFPLAQIGIFEPLRGYSAGPFPQTQDTYYYGDFKRIFNRIYSVMKSHNETIDFFHVFSPNEVIGTSERGWLAGKVYEIGDYFHSRDIRFGLIYFSQTGGDESDTQFFEDIRISKEYILLIEENHDTFLMNYILQSFTEHPSKCLPEDEPYTYTYLINEIEKITTAPTRTPKPTYDNVWVLESWCEQHVGCQKVEVKNQSDYWVNIVLKSQEFWGATKMFSIPPRGNTWITLKPGSYQFIFTSCGGETVNSGNHNLNSNWYIVFKQDECE